MAIYKYKDFTYSQEEIDDKINSSDISLEDFLVKNDIQKIEEEKEVVEASSPVVEEDFQTDTAIGADVVSTDVPALDTNTELDSVDISLELPETSVDPNNIMSKKRFDELILEGDDAEEDLTSNLNQLLKSQGTGIKIEEAAGGRDQIILTNIETGEKSEPITLPSGYNKDKFDKNERIKSEIDENAYETIMQFINNQPKTDPYVGSVYRSTGMQPENYFKIDRSSRMMSDVILNSSQMNNIANIAGENYLKAFKNPSIAGLQLGKNADRAASRNYTKEQRHKIQDWAYEQTKITSGIDFTKQDFMELYGDGENLLQRARFQQDNSNNLDNLKQYDKKTMAAFIANNTRIRLKKESKAINILAENKSSIYESEDKIKILNQRILEGPSDDVKDEQIWLNSINDEISLEEENIKTSTSNIEAAAVEEATDYAKSQQRTIMSAGNIPQTIGYNEAYAQKYKELTDPNYLNGESPETRRVKRLQDESSYFNAGFDSVSESGLFQYILALQATNPGMTDREAAQVFQKTKYREKADVINDARNSMIKFSIVKPSGGNTSETKKYLKRINLLSKSNATEKDGVYEISVFDAKQQIGLNFSDLSYDTLGTRRFEISKEDENAMLAFEHDSDVINGELAALFETIDLNKNVKNIKKDSLARVFFQSAKIATGDFLGVETDYIGNKQKLATINRNNEDYNVQYAQSISRGEMPAATFTSEQVNSLKTTFGEDFAEMAGGFTPLFAQIMALSAATGGVMNLVGAAKWIKGALDSGSTFQKLSAYMATGAIEEMKMQFLDFPTGTGFVFGTSGTLVRNVTLGSITGRPGLNVLNPFFEKFAKPAVSGVAASEVATVLEKVGEDLMGDAEFKQQFDRLYGDYSEVQKRLLLNGLLFASTGAVHLKSTDFMGTNSKVKLKNDLLMKANDILIDYKNIPDGKRQLKIKDISELTTSELNKYTALRQSASNLEALIAQTKVEPKFDLDSPTINQDIQNARTNSIVESIKASGVPKEILNSVETKVLDSKSGRLIDEFGKEVPARIVEGKNGKWEILLNKELIKKQTENGTISGVNELLNHEFAHLITETHFKNIPNAKAKFTQNTLKSLRGLNINDLGFDPVLLEKWIGKKYIGKDGKVNPELEGKEGLAFAVQFLSRPEAYYALKSPTMVKEIINEIQAIFKVNEYSGSPPKKAKELASFMTSVLRGSYKNPDAMVKALGVDVNKLGEEDINFVRNGKDVGLVVQKDSKSLAAYEKFVSDKNLNISNKNTDIENRILQITNNKPNERLKDLSEKDQIIFKKELEENNKGALGVQIRTAIANARSINLESAKKVSEADLEAGFNKEFADLLNNYKPLVKGKDGVVKRIPFGAYMSGNLFKRYGDILEANKPDSNVRITEENMTIIDRQAIENSMDTVVETGIDSQVVVGGRLVDRPSNVVEKINVLDGTKNNPTVERKGKPENEIRPGVFIKPEFKEVYDQQVMEYLGLVLNPKNPTTYKQITDLSKPFLGRFAGKMMGVDGVKASTPNSNLSQAEANKIQRFFSNPANLKYTIKILQEANVPLKGVNGETIFNPGAPTGIPNNVRDLFYEKGKRVGNNYQYRMKKNIALKDIYEAIGIEFNIKSKSFTTRVPDSQTLKGLFRMLAMAQGNKFARMGAEKIGLNNTIIDSMGEGRSKFMDAKSIESLKGVKRVLKEENLKNGIKVTDIVDAINDSDLKSQDKDYLIDQVPEVFMKLAEKKAAKELFADKEALILENSDFTKEEFEAMKKVAAESNALIAKKLGLNPKNTSYSELNKSPLKQKLFQNYMKKVLKKMGKLQGLDKAQVNAIIRTMGIGSKSNMELTMVNGKLKYTNFKKGSEKTGGGNEVFINDYVGPGAFKSGRKLTKKEIAKRQALFIPAWGEFKQKITKKQIELKKKYGDNILKRSEELNAYSYGLLTKKGFKKGVDGKFLLKNGEKVPFTYAETAAANQAVAKDFIMSMYDVYAAAKPGKAKTMAKEMMLLSFGQQTNIATGLIKSLYKVESIALEGSKQIEYTDKKGNLKKTPANHIEHALQLLNFTDFMFQPGGFKSRKAFQKKLDFFVDVVAKQHVIKKELASFNDAGAKGTTSYSPTIGETATGGTDFTSNVFSTLSQMKNQVMLTEPGMKPISLAEQIASTIPASQKATVLTELQTLINSKPENVTSETILLANSLNKKTIKTKREVDENNFELIKLANEKLPSNSTTSEVLDVLKNKDIEISKDIKSSFDSKDLSGELNAIIREGSSEIRNYSSAKARLLGQKVKDDIWIPSSAEDFKGLIYRTLGKEKLGENQFAWYKENLIDPLNKAENLMAIDATHARASFEGLKKQLKNVPKQLKKDSSIKGITNENAIRIYNWARQGMEVPGLSKKDLKEVEKYVDANPEFVAFSDKLIEIGKGDGYPPPTEMWLTGTMGTDLRSGLSTVKRGKYLEATGFTNNIDKIYSKQNLNNLEAKYGTKYRTALENMIARIKSGSNRKPSKNAWENNLADWLNGANAVTMSLNSKSGVMQLTSSINFLNMSDNNPLMAGKAIANIPSYAAAVKKIWQSDYLQRRMGGDKIDVSQNEVAEAAKSNGVKGLTNLILQKGYIVTRAADAAAIASGGATFLINRTNTYYKKIFKSLKEEITSPEGKDFLSSIETRIKANKRLRDIKDWKDQKNKDLVLKEAERMAFEDFRLISEQTQQSAATSMISSEQASISGRAILAFNNTPAQYTRITKRAVEDLMAGRGNKGEHIRKIIYYSVAQNLLFNGMSNAMFGDIWETDEQAANPNVQKRKQDRNIRTVNGMLDTMLRGSGIKGAALSTLKNMLIKVYNENKEKRPDYAEVALEALDFVPSLDTKIRKLRKAGNAISWNYKDIKKLGLMDSKNPAYLASSNIISAATNLPADRLLMKFNNMRAVMTEDMEGWQKVARALGWSEYAAGPYKDFKKSRSSSKKSGFEDSFDFSSDFNSGNDDFNSDFN